MSAMIDPELYLVNNNDTTDDTNYVLSSCRSLLTWSSTGERVLDVGCGPGDVTVTAVRSQLPPGSILVGGDVSKKMIEFAKSKYEDELTQFKEMDISSENLFGTTWKKNEFTKIVSFYTLHRLKNLKQVFKNIYDLLTPGGEVVLLFITGDHPIGRIHQELVKTEQYAKHRETVDDVYHFYSYSDPVSHLRDIMSSVNFEIIKVIREPRVHNFGSLDGFMGSFTSVSPLVHEMSPGDFQKAMNDARKLAETWKSMDFSDEGKGISKYSIVVSVARKPKTEPALNNKNS